MEALSTSPADLLSTRLLLLRDLAHSLELSQVALTRNDAEMIARGAARQAELCRQWSLLEDQLRHLASEKAPPSLVSLASVHGSSEIEKEFLVLTARIRHLTRVHCSLLRHLQRSLAIVAHVAASCAPTYTPAPHALRIDPRPQAGG
jgi:hypothetical protein